MNKLRVEGTEKLEKTIFYFLWASHKRISLYTCENAIKSGHCGWTYRG